MKLVQTLITSLAIIFALNVNAQGEDVMSHLPPDIITILTSPTGPTFPPIPYFTAGKSKSGDSKAKEVADYLVNFNNSIKSSRNKIASKSTLEKQGAAILKIAKNDPKYQMVLPYINNFSTYRQLALDIADIRDEIMLLDGGPQFYAQLQYSLQLVNNYARPTSRLDSSGKGGPNPYDIEDTYMALDCGTTVATWIAAGASVGAGTGGVTIPVVGAVPGTVVGGVVGAIIGGINCLID